MQPKTATISRSRPLPERSLHRAWLCLQVLKRAPIFDLIADPLTKEQILLVSPASPRATDGRSGSVRTCTPPKERRESTEIESPVPCVGAPPRTPRASRVGDSRSLIRRSAQLRGESIEWLLGSSVVGPRLPGHRSSREAEIAREVGIVRSEVKCRYAV